VTAGAGLAVAGLREEPVGAKPKPPQAKQPDAPKSEKKDDEPKEFEPALVKMKPLAANPKDNELHKLLKERFNAALAELQARYERVRAGMLGNEGLYDAGSRVKLAGLELYDDPKEKIALLEQYLELAKEIERIMKVRAEAGRVGPEELQ